MTQKLPNAPDQLEALAALPGLERLRFKRIVRDLPQRLVCEVMLNGEPAFLKQVYFKGAENYIRRSAEWLEAAAALLDQDQNAVPKVLAVLPEHGVLITSLAPGVEMSKALQSASIAKRQALLTRAGEWLVKLSQLSQVTGEFGPFYWLRTLKEKLPFVTIPEDEQPTIYAHIFALTQRAELLRLHPVIRAQTHGDFKPDNLFVDDSRNPITVTGIDMHERREYPVVRDVAQMLVWLESRRDAPSSDKAFGVDRSDLLALTDAKGLIGPDQMPILHFMIGISVMVAYFYNVQNLGQKPQRRRAMLDLMRDWAVNQPEVTAVSNASSASGAAVTADNARS